MAGLLLFAIPGCGSRDTRAANDAAKAEAALQQGAYEVALKAIRKALDERDDVSDYWLVLGRIDTAINDMPGAFTAYENAIELDRGNVEALRLLCQLGLAVGAPDKVDKYADQLLLIAPNDTMPLVMKGSAALLRYDTPTAMQFAERVLAKAPQDSEAQLLKARALAAEDKFPEAARFIEATFAGGTIVIPRLVYLKELYTKAHDRPNYERTLMRLAQAKPNNADVQIDFADMLYQVGQGGAANAVIVETMRRHPGDLVTAAKILDTWLKQGPDALTLAQIQQQAAGASLEMKAAYAQFANEIGHPEIARNILDLPQVKNPTDFANADAQAALAYAIGLGGQRADAIARLSGILEVEEHQPRALLARARLRLLDKDVNGAIEDARNAVAQDPVNMAARLSLVDALLAHGDRGLAESALQEAIHAMPEDPRPVARLAGIFLARGDRARAVELAREMTQDAPVSLRAFRLRQSIDPGARAEE